jgi:enoyl-[acyl-carrier-protein] reductase (NADH)
MIDEGMKGKRGLIMGVANDHSIAWGIAKTLAAQGAELAFTYQGEALGKRVKPLAQSLGSSIVLPCDVEDIASVDAVFADARASNGAARFPGPRHRFSDKNELKGRYADTTRENFVRTMVISCFSFTEARQARRGADAERRRDDHADLQRRLDRVMPNYNVMGVAKAALEASVRYLAAISARAASASTRSRPARSARSPAPASATRARCSRSSSAFAARPRRDARGARRRRRSICCPICRPASPAKSTSSIPATTSSRCRAEDLKATA